MMNFIRNPSTTFTLVFSAPCVPLLVLMKTTLAVTMVKRAERNGEHRLLDDEASDLFSADSISCKQRAPETLPATEWTGNC